MAAQGVFAVKCVLNSIFCKNRSYNRKKFVPMIDFNRVFLYLVKNGSILYCFFETKHNDKVVLSTEYGYLCTMITKEQVEKFLEGFSLKVKIFGIRFRDDRQKNQNSLVELGITPNQRMEVIMNLSCYDYSEGPIVDALNNQGEMWVFGKDVRGNEIYIKITLGKPNSHTICISFHKAEYPISYPLKNKHNGQ